MKNKKINIIVLVVALFLFLVIVLWVSGIIPKQIAKKYATNYLRENFPEIKLEYSNIEWNSAFGDYSITFKDENDRTYGFLIGPKYFPIHFGQGMFGFEEKYKETYEEPKEIVDLDSFYAQRILKNKDIRELSKDYTTEQIQKDNCFVVGATIRNDNLYNEFMDKYHKKETAFIRVVQSTIEGDLILIDVLYDGKCDKIYLVMDTTRDEYAGEEDRKITLKVYEKTGVWNYQNTEYWVVYNGELPDGKTAEYTLDSDGLFIITKIN